ncbi:DUF3085 domain-containing protein [Streptomyces sp. NPDC015220]|uniref:DUF3085 domain-containing protein n=1 Tax=Streptomyces sp. NPDC015220 TaxID=3364947 RepID=UPI0036FCFE30
MPKHDPAADHTPAVPDSPQAADHAPAVPDSPQTAMTHPEQVRHLLTLPADQRPDWLNEFLGTMTIPPIPDTSTNPLLDVAMANTTHGQKNATLRFPLARVLAAAEHAAAAPEHKLGYGETEATPRLWWVKDDGTYLMSNGRYPIPDSNRPPTVVYADGWGPGTDARSILGGDDFRESVDLTTPLDDGRTTLLDVLRAATAEGATRFLFEVTFDDHYMTLNYRAE